MSAPRMDSGDPEGPLGRFLERLCSSVAMFGGITLLFIMMVSSVSVIGRNFPQLLNLVGFKLSPMSIPGDIEIVQLGGAIAIFAFLPYCQIKRANVFVDFFTGWMSPRYRAVFDVAANLLFLAITICIAWQLGHGTVDKFTNKDTTMVLRIPESWPFVAALALSWLLVIVTAYTVLRSAMEVVRNRTIGAAPPVNH
jgi:TRAP-type mannitol/chloroaromatic compound transport system permease small subunit